MKPSQATRLVDLALEADAELWHAPTGDPYITILVENDREHHRLSARAVREWLARHHHLETGGAPGSQAIADALAVLAGKARHEGAEYPVAVRVASKGGAVYLDLGDPSWRAIAITAAGWRIDPRPPVHLLRSRGMLALPAPTRGGSIDALGDLLAVSNANDYRLIVGWLIGALKPSGPYPLLAMAGEQGTGKSTRARMTRRLIDPHVAELRAEPRLVDDIMIAAMRSRVVAIDNLSHLAPWLSDALCRLSTGGALTKRELYTDDDEVIVEAMRPVILTSIADIVTRGDLLDRTIVVTLPPITGLERRSEADLWRAFDAAAPGILGGLLDAVSGALACEPTTIIDELPRMADWARWVTAAESAIGWQRGSILRSYTAMRGEVIEATLDAEVVAIAIRAMKLPWEGTTAELLARLTPAGRPPRGWPTSPRGLSAALRRLSPALRYVGIDVVLPTEDNRRGHDRKRVIEIKKAEPPDNPPERPAASSASATPAISGPISAADSAAGSSGPERSAARPAADLPNVYRPMADAADADGSLQTCSDEDLEEAQLADDFSV